MLTKVFGLTESWKNLYTKNQGKIEGGKVCCAKYKMKLWRLEKNVWDTDRIIMLFFVI